MTVHDAFAAERLGDILNEAVVLQPAAEQLILECAGSGPKDGELGQRGRRIAYRYFALREWLHHLPPSAPHDRADRLLNYHHQMVLQALSLAFWPESPAKSRIVEHMQWGLGDPARQLRDLADAEMEKHG